MQFEFPHANIDDHQKELFIRDIYFLNYHINHDKWDWYKLFDIVHAHRFMDDFCHALDTDNWYIAVTEDGEGDASYTCTDMVNGVLYMVTDDALNDLIEITQECECWKLVQHFPLYAEMRFRLIDVSHSHFWFGLITGTTYFTAPDDFVVFEKDGVDLNLEFSVSKDGTGSEDVISSSVLQDGVWLRIGFHFDGEGTIRYFVFRDSDNYCLVTGSITANIPDDIELALGWGIRNAEAGEVKGMQVDYVKCVQQRVIE